MPGQVQITNFLQWMTIAKIKKSTKVSHSCVLKNGLASIFIFNKVEVIGRNKTFEADWSNVFTITVSN